MKCTLAVNLSGDKSKLSGVETRRGNITLTLLLLLLPSYTLTLAGCIANSNAIPPENLEAIAQGIDKSLICPICPSETIDQAQVELAKQMRIMVREKLGQGESRDEILQFFVDRYGPVVLAEPPKSGFNILIWLIPPIAFLVGIIVLVMTILAMRRNHLRNSQSTSLATSGLEQYLAQVDREIGQLALRDIHNWHNYSSPKPKAQDVGPCMDGAE